MALSPVGSLRVRPQLRVGCKAPATTRYIALHSTARYTTPQSSRPNKQLPRHHCFRSDSHSECSSRLPSVSAMFERPRRTTAPTFPGTCRLPTVSVDARKRKKEKKSSQTKKEQKGGILESIKGRVEGLADRISGAVGMDSQLVAAGLYLYLGITGFSIFTSFILPTALAAASLTFFAGPFVLFTVISFVSFMMFAAGLVFPVIAVGTASWAAWGLASGALVLSKLVLLALPTALIFFIFRDPDTTTTDLPSSEADTAQQPLDQADDSSIDDTAKEFAEFDRQLLGGPERWSVAEVGAWLEVVGLEELKGRFELNEVDGITLLTLDSEELREELGVGSLQKRRKVMEAIDTLKSK